MNELDKLRRMLKKAEIPFESIVKRWNEDLGSCAEVWGDAGVYLRNQIIYGRFNDGTWAFDGVCQYGSYGAALGLIETWGPLGSDEMGEPMVMNAKEAFRIIKKDWKKNEKNEKN